jgi:hypothetical protein
MRGHWFVIHSPEYITKTYEINWEMNSFAFQWFGYVTYCSSQYGQSKRSSPYLSHAKWFTYFPFHLFQNEKTQILTTFLWLRLASSRTMSYEPNTFDKCLCWSLTVLYLCIPHQYWHHEFMVWEPNECDGVTRISIPVNQLWSPDIIVYELWVDLLTCTRITWKSVEFPCI